MGDEMVPVGGRLEVVCPVAERRAEDVVGRYSYTVVAVVFGLTGVSSDSAVIAVIAELFFSTQGGLALNKNSFAQNCLSRTNRVQGD
jgi:hypothetical protein